MAGRAVGRLRIADGVDQVRFNRALRVDSAPLKTCPLSGQNQSLKTLEWQPGSRRSGLAVGYVEANKSPRVADRAESEKRQDHEAIRTK
jgi:hypothetical protein